jgi:hypothetical protein
LKSMNDATCEIKSQALLNEFAEIMAFVRTSFQEERTAHEVETGVWQRIRKLGRSIFGAWLDLFGDGDAGERIVLEDGREVRRLDALHRREIQNVFGLFELNRAVYGTREGQKIEAVPLDERLQLPQGKNSYLLQDWDQALAVEMPYATVSATLARILGFTQSVHTLERNQREMAAVAEDFWKDRPIPPTEQEGEILVCTADGKGVPMRGGAKAPAGVEPPSTGGVRPGTKKRQPCSGRSIRWPRSFARPRRYWMRCFKKHPLASCRRALVPATSMYGPPCSATTGTRPSRKFKRSSVGWRTK